MYTLLVGAKKNVGDFLIVERAKKLLEYVRKEKEFLELNRWLPLDDKLEEMNNTKAIILCGGPLYAKNFYPHRIPLVRKIEDIKVPIIPFGLGWCGQPANHPQNFSFDERSKKVLNLIHNSCKFSSCRDIITQQILEREGFKNIIMTGCPSMVRFRKSW